jgi:hypothetical protein
MADGLHEDEYPPEDQRRHAREGELGRRVRPAARRGCERGQDERQRGEGAQDRQGVAGSLDLEREDVVPYGTHQQAQAHDAIAHDHHDREHRVAGEGAGCRAAGQHHREDQRQLHDGDGQRENQRAERLADTMRDNLGVIYPDQDRRDEGRGGQRKENPAQRLRPHRREPDAGRDRHHKTPRWDNEQSPDHRGPSSLRPSVSMESIDARRDRTHGGGCRPRPSLQHGSATVLGSEGRTGQTLFELDIEGGDHIPHDAVEAAKRDQFDDARSAMDFDEPLLHLRRD